MSEFRFDKRLGIRTGGLREWPDDIYHYNRCEPTPYIVLEHLFKHYKLNRTDKLVDFGSGKGRVAFYIHNRFKIPVVGIEAQDDVIDEALRNKKRYRMRAKHIHAPIHFEYALAENYEIKADENIFYFFNPFSADVFKEILVNIVDSLEKNRREVHIILYYPMPKYKEIMRDHSSFEIYNKLVMPNARDSKEKIIIYRSIDVS